MKHPHLALWFPAQSWGTGVGDYLQIIAIIPEWQKRHPGAPVSIAYEPGRNTDVLLHIPGVIYHVGVPPHDGFENAHDLAAYPPRRPLWERYGLDYDNKRLHYFVTAEERAYAEAVWRDFPRPWIITQTTGGMPSKRWPFWDTVSETMAVETGGSVVVLDPLHHYHGSRCRRMGAGRIRDVLAVVAHADLFLGFDSGPFYAAIGSDVPAAGLFHYVGADGLFAPVISPPVIALEGRLEDIPPAEVMRAAKELLAVTFYAGKEGTWKRSFASDR